MKEENEREGKGEAEIGGSEYRSSRFGPDTLLANASNSLSYILLWFALGEESCSDQFPYLETCLCRNENP